jgi:geranylgeranyl pyrophosphate synthase
VKLETIFIPVAGELEDVEAKLVEWAGGVTQAVAVELAQIVGSGGKRIRPACLLLSVGMGGVDGSDGDARERAHNLAVSVELIHTASLIHDDIVDGASLRRGKPTLHMRRSVELALLVGDLLYSRVLKQLTDDAQPQTYRIVADTVHQMVMGELAETLRRDDIGLNESDYMQILNDKTGALFACACFLGGQVAGLSADDCERLQRYGKNLGLAFQIVDDVLDVCELERELGKPVGADMGEGKVTLPLIHALAQDRGTIAELFRSRDIAALRAEMRRHGSLAYALEKGREAAARAVEALESLTVNVRGEHVERCRRGLAEMTRYVVGCGDAALVKDLATSAKTG